MMNVVCAGRGFKGLDLLLAKQQKKPLAKGCSGFCTYEKNDPNSYLRETDSMAQEYLPSARHETETDGLYQ